jgi:hypothetical protein
LNNIFEDRKVWGAKRDKNHWSVRDENGTFCKDVLVVAECGVPGKQPHKCTMSF